MLGDYAVAVNLALKNNVSRGLAAITSEFVSLNKGIAGAQGNLDAFHRKVKEIKTMGMIGAGIAGLGVGSLMMLKGPYEDAKRLEQAKTDFENLNLSASDNSMAFAQAAANSHKILGTNITDNIKQINDLHTAFGDLHHALKSSEAFAQYTFAAKIANGGIEVPGLASESVRALEQRGGRVINDDATFLEELKMQSRVFFGSRGKVGGKDFFAASQTGGMAYTLYDKNYLYGEFAAFMQAKSGATAGTAGMTMFSSLIGGHMDNKAKGFLADLGMLQVGVSKAQIELVNQAVKGLDIPDKAKHQLMKAMMPITGGLKDQFLDIAAQRPDVLVNDYLVPAIRKKFGMNMTDEQIGQLVTEKFNRGTSKDIGELIVNHLKFVKDAGIFANAKDFSGAYQAYKKSPLGAEVAAEESWRNLSTMIGVTFIPKITAGLGSLAEGLDSLSIWTQKHPNLTKDLTAGFISLGSAMAIGGTIIATTSAFKGIGMALEFASIGGSVGIGKIGGGFSLVGDGIGLVGKSITAFSLVYAAWKTGQEVGNIINNHLSDDQKDGIGHFLTSAMALAGDKDAQKALQLSDKNSGVLKFMQGMQNFHNGTNDLDKTIFAARDKVLHSIGIGTSLPPMPPLPPDNSKRYVSPPPNNRGGANSTADGHNTPAAPPVVNVHAQITLDGKELTHQLVSTVTLGPAGVNSTGSLLVPSMSSYGLA